MEERHSPRHDANLAKLRQSIDQRLGDSVAQVFRLRIAARIFEREDCQRIDRL